MDNNILIAIISGGLSGSIIAYFQANRFRRKQIVADAFETALARVEVLYKVRRRTTNKALLSSDEISIRDELHNIQLKTDYYIGILYSESIWLGASYEKFVLSIKTATEVLFREAWAESPKGVGVDLKKSEHPQIAEARNRFIKDFQRYFNPFKRCFFSAIYRLSKWCNCNG